MESILDEVKELVEKGYKEITLLGQNIVSSPNASAPLFAYKYLITSFFNNDRMLMEEI